MPKPKDKSKAVHRRYSKMSHRNKLHKKHKGGAYGMQPDSSYGMQPDSSYGMQPDSSYGMQPDSSYGMNNYTEPQNQLNQYMEPSPYSAQYMEPSPSSNFDEQPPRLNSYESMPSNTNFASQPIVSAQNNRGEYDDYDFLNTPSFSSTENKDYGFDQDIIPHRELDDDYELEQRPAKIFSPSLSKYDDDDDNYIFTVPTKLKIPHLRSIPRRVKNLAKRTTHKLAKRARNYARRSKNAVMSLFGRKKSIGGTRRRHHRFTKRH
jgi:hypothetical protein